MSLMRSRRFLPLFVTQFLGAFNDNVLKNALVMLITYRLSAQTGGNAQLLVTLAAGLFILPYFLFSATAGQIADKYDRAMLTRTIKLAEIVIMALAAAGFYFQHVEFLLAVLFCLGVQATFFGPIKYALLPQHLQESELLLGNAYIEAGTFLAILLGTMAGGLLVLQDGGTFLVSLAMLACSAAGYASSFAIPPAPAPEPSLKINPNIAQETWRIIAYSRRDRGVYRCILGISWFWLIGATFLAQFPSYAKDIVHADQTVVTLLLTVFTFGIGAGSLLCNKLLRGEMKATYVFAAALGISLFGFDLYFASACGGAETGDALETAASFIGHAASWRILIDLFGIALCGGVYIVPLYAIMQHRSEPAWRARIIAANNVMNALFMVASAIATLLMLKAAFTIPQVFLCMSAANLLVALYIRRLPAARHG